MIQQSKVPLDNRKYEARLARHFIKAIASHQKSLVYDNPCLLSSNIIALHRVFHMESFENLSIGDSFTSGMEQVDDELVGLSDLSISKNGPTLSPQLINRFMPHFPSSPSPLRNTLDFDTIKGDEEEDDLMEIDEVDDAGFQDEYNQKPIESPVNAIEKAIVEEIEATPEDPPKQEKIESQAQDVKAVENIVSPHHSTVIKALLSPTDLGVAAATKVEGVVTLSPSATQGSNKVSKSNSEGGDIIENEEVEDEINSSIGYNKSSKYTNAFDSEIIKRELRSRSKYQPIQVSFNTHNYFYSDEDGVKTYSLTKPKDNNIDDFYDQSEASFQITQTMVT